jgi:ADP-ribose pyrophosphatase
MTEGPLNLIRRKLVGENRYFSVFFDSLDEEGQSVTDDYLVLSPRNHTANRIFGAGVLPVREGKIGLLEIYRHPMGRYSWELPGGFVEEGETPIDTAKRELSEEAGVTCKTEHLHDLGIIAPFPSSLGGQIQIFVAFNCYPSDEGSTPELGHKQFKWFTNSEVESMIAEEEIIESGTLIALYRCTKLQLE